MAAIVETRVDAAMIETARKFESIVHANGIADTNDSKPDNDLTEKHELEEMDCETNDTAAEKWHEDKDESISTEKCTDKDANETHETQISSCTDNNSNAMIEDDRLDCKGEQDRAGPTESTVAKRFLTLIDSDSEDENVITPRAKSGVRTKDDSDSAASVTKSTKSKKSNKSENSKNFKKKRNANRIVDTDSEDESNDSDNSKDGEEDSATNTSANKVSKEQNRFQTLIDSDTEEDQEPSTLAEDNDKTLSTKKGAGGKHNKRTGSLRASKEEAMKQIHSETQRLLRESEISLPYHRPKQRTLQEFLNRKKISEALPKAPTVAAKLKMSSEIVGKVLMEKEKEAELFYKSSDSEDETHEVLPTINEVDKGQNQRSPMDTESIGIEDTQKVNKSIQDSQNKKEVIKQGSLELGAPRKLFGENFDEQRNKDEEIADSPSATSDIDRRSKADDPKHHTQYKQGLKNASIPRKLFNGDFEVTGSENDAWLDNNDRLNDDSEESIEGVVRCIVDTLINAATGDGSDSVLPDNVPDNVPDDDATLKCNSKTDVSTNFERNGVSSRNEEKQSNESENLQIYETPRPNEEEIVHLLRKSNTENISDDFEKENGNKERASFNKIQTTAACSESDDYSSIVKKSLGIGVDDTDNYNEYGLPPPVFEEDNASTLRKTKKLLNLPSLEPKLRGVPGMVIDLSDNVKPDKKGINSLIDRFFSKHSKVNKQVDDSTDVTVINIKETAQGPLPVKETLTYKLPTVTNEDPELSKPGAKLFRLREELRQKMALKRNEEWRQKELEFKEQENEDEEWEIEKHYEDNEKPPRKIHSDTEESEPEENDVYVKERKRTTCTFLDEEAEVSDNDAVDEDDEDDNDDNDDNDDEDLSENDEAANEETSSDSTVNLQENKTSDREPFEEDSNLTNASEKNRFVRSDLCAFGTSSGNDVWATDESEIPASQPHVEDDVTRQMCQTPLNKTSLLDFVSPATQLTALNESLNSARKDSIKNKRSFDGIDAAAEDNTQSTAKPQQDSRRLSLQKKLFADTTEGTKDGNFTQFCSEKASTSEKDSLVFTKEEYLTESQLLSLCSGTFSTQAQDVKRLGTALDRFLEKDEASESMKLFLDDDSIPDAKNISNMKKDVAKSGIPRNNTRIVSSDEEDVIDTTSRTKKFKKRKVKKLDLSDDEDADEDNAKNVEEEDEEEDEEEEQDGDGMDLDEKYVDYDSEENEVVVVPKSSIKKYAAGFLEEEAELSESDWEGSADEDEKDLDKLEAEEGDEEEIDENKVKDQLERIHMRQILDEDQRDVRMLQELLFEDGDLHTDGSGRERKFKWRNIDKTNESNDNPLNLEDKDGWVDLPEDENETEWRKMKHEREKFLAEKKIDIDDEIENELNNSQIFKLGMNVLKKMKIGRAQKHDIPTDTTDVTEPRMPHTISEILNNSNLGEKSRAIQNVMKKRSLLAKGEASLARIAMIAKQSDSSVLPVNTRNFVFAHISPSVKQQTETTEETDSKQETDLSNKYRKRKATSNTTPRSAKRFRTEGSFAKGKKRL